MTLEVIETIVKLGALQVGGVVPIIEDMVGEENLQATAPALEIGDDRVRHGRDPKLKKSSLRQPAQAHFNPSGQFREFSFVSSSRRLCP